MVPNPKALQDLADSMKLDGNWETICRNSELTKRVLKDMQTLVQGE